ncbi:hypothetical protein HWD03_gp155 [Alteromonas phage vB_AmeM_PT11-V22]|uniref:Uncharacterized protein n=1 Tax=Alteromonas phage vB_AmeM_PT11-V22 TaxID=2704031 RepID=A0A6C0R1X3_9CAUD|nr:hypothetical protein HWD03_gp155 [Alteromonas phage vB_AmeM_PT11-V22]QHZ59797.1 hypothetical protein [Alteromonas phage vB_AmeM_PT11-V22]
MQLGVLGTLGVYGVEVITPPPITDQEQVLRIASTQFTVVGNGQYFGYATRDNISILKFKAENNFQGGINLSNGYFDFENNGVDKVVIEVDNTPYFISSEDSSITFSKENLICRFGDLDIPHNYTGKINVIIYVGNDPDGIYMSSHSGRYVMTVRYQA